MQQAIDLRLNYPVLDGQNIEFKALLKKSLEQPSSFLSLAPTGGSPKDREIAVEWLSNPEYIIDPADVYVGAGGHNICIVSLLAAKLQNKTIAVEELTYSNFLLIAQLFNIKLIPCLADNLGLIPSSLEEVCKTNKVDALYIMPTVNNPTGTVMPIERREEVVSIARANNLIIIEDDAYGFLEETFLPNFFNLAPERSFYIYSLSKPLGRGIKTSYLLAPKALSGKVIEALKVTNTDQSLLFSWALNSMIETGRLKRIIKEKQEQGHNLQLKAKSLLSNYIVYGHTNGWHLWLTLPAHIKADELNQRLAKAGVFVSPSTVFSASEKLYNGAIRIALGGESDFDRVIDGIEIIKQQISLSGE